MRNRLTTFFGFSGATALALLSASPASATQYLFEFSGTGFFGGTLNGSGTLTTDDMSFVNALNGYTAQNIIGITGTFNGSAITGLAPGVFGANNLFYLNGPFFVDGNGLGFRTAAGVSGESVRDQRHRLSGQYDGRRLADRPCHRARDGCRCRARACTWAMMLRGFGATGIALRRRRKGTAAPQFA